jgi:hypothetical protein
MDAGAAALRAVHMQAPLSKIDLRPAKTAKLGSAEAMPIGQQDRTRIPVAIPPSLALHVARASGAAALAGDESVCVRDRGGN